ncbi:Spo0E family sporulation regulatory protein-aspartic acid phosphatase [Caloramator sp. mosi_1]
MKRWNKKDEYHKILKLSQELDKLIVSYTKKYYLYNLNCLNIS